MVRGRDGLSLTDAGSSCTDARTRSASAPGVDAHRTGGHGGRVAGTLTLASLPTVTATLLAPQLRAFAERHPAVTIRLLEGSEEEVRDWLDQGAAEAGVVKLPARGLQTAVLGDQEMVAVVPADSWLAARDVVDYAELAKEPFIRSYRRLRRGIHVRSPGGPASSSTWPSKRAKCPRCSKSCARGSG